MKAQHPAELGFFYTMALHYVRPAYVCGVAVDLVGGYGWLFSSLDSVVLNDKSQTGEEVEI